MTVYDLVIRNGTVVDGSGSPGFRGDVGVVGGRIARIGRIPNKGITELDAEGHVISPGFIEGHTHMDAQVFWDPLGTCSCWHGITTVVMGNCGFTLAPVRQHSQQLVVENLERAEDIPSAVLEAGIPWSWESFSDYLDAVDRQPKAINYAAYAGHSALRTWAMGERAFDGPATAAEVAEMERELGDALDAGAIGLSTSRSENHIRTDGRPVASVFAEWSEVCALAGVLTKAGRGIFELSQEPASRSSDPVERTEWFQRLRQLAVDSGVPVTFGATREMLSLIDDTVAAGGRMFGQWNSRGTASILSFRTNLPFDRLPGWGEIRRQPLENQRIALADPMRRAQLVSEARHGDYGHVVGADPRKPDFAKMFVLDRAVPPHLTVAEAARREGLDPVEYMIGTALATNFDQMFTQPFDYHQDDDILTMLEHPHTVLAFSDSGAHVGQIIDCSIYTHLLAYWVRQKEALSLEAAVRMLTLDPSTAWGFSDRGLLREGFIADINVFDPHTVAPELPTVEADLPGGVSRLKQRATGFLATVVSGQVVFANGVHTGALPGSLLRGGLSDCWTCLSVSAVGRDEVSKPEG